MTTDPNPTDLRLAAFRDAGTALGMLRGQRAARTAAEDATFAHAYQQAAHAQLKTAGLCTCPPGDWAAIVDRAVLEQLQAELTAAREALAGADAMAASALTRAGQLARDKAQLVRQLEESRGERRTLEIKIHGAMDFINESPDATAAEIETAIRDIFGWAPKLSTADVDNSPVSCPTTPTSWRKSARAYAELTGGTLSKPNTAAHHVIEYAERKFAETYAGLACEAAETCDASDRPGSAEALRALAEDWHQGAWDQHRAQRRQGGRDHGRRAAHVMGSRRG